MRDVDTLAVPARRQNGVCVPSDRWHALHVRPLGERLGGERRRLAPAELAGAGWGARRAGVGAGTCADLSPFSAAAPLRGEAGDRGATSATGFRPARTSMTCSSVK